MNDHRGENFSHQDKPTYEGKPFFRRKQEIDKKSKRNKKCQKDTLSINKSSKRSGEKIRSEKRDPDDALCSKKSKQ